MVLGYLICIYIVILEIVHTNTCMYVSSSNCNIVFLKESFKFKKENFLFVFVFEGTWNFNPVFDGLS